MDAFLEAINSFLYSPAMIGVQVFSFIISVGLGAFFFRMHLDMGTFTRNLAEAGPAIRPTNLDISDLRTKWQQAQTRARSGDEAQVKMAIIEADTILDEAIKQMGYEGETMGERMKNIQRGKFPLLDEAWRVHRVRNYIVHDPTYQISSQAASRIFGIYEDIFRKFGIIEEEAIPVTPEEDITPVEPQ